MSTARDVVLAGLAAILAAVVRVVWRLGERVTRLEAREELEARRSPVGDG